MTLYVNIYAAGRAYGGPEEGGWWYDVASPVGSIPVDWEADEWERARQGAINLGILNREGDIASIDYETHEHTEWCRPDERDVAYLGEDIPTISARCHEAEWREHLETTLRRKAERIRDEWLEKYPRSGKRSSVLGGEDYDVVIQKHFARPYPQEVPRYE